MQNLGIKQVTSANWLSPDDAIIAFSVIEPSGRVRTIEGEEWVQALSRPQLADHVPEPIRTKFEVCRGAMCYAYFFYPLFTLATQELFRVADAALLHRCRGAGTIKAPDSFDGRIRHLVAIGVLTSAKEELWHRLRQPRNSASHQAEQDIYTPGVATQMLRRVAEELNALFDGV